MNINKTPIYPIEPWNVTEEEFSIKTNYRNETTFSLSNGYIGTRGTHEEGYDFSEEEGLEGNFINGFYESEEIRYGEWNFGFPKTSQSLLNLPNLKTTQLYIENELFDMRTGQIERYKRILHMRDGVTTRSLVWTSPAGNKVRVETSHIVSLVNKNLMATRFCVTPLNFSGTLRFVSRLDADVENHTRTTNPLVDYGPFGPRLEAEELFCDKDVLFYQGNTRCSGLTMACGSRHYLQGNFDDCVMEQSVESNELVVHLNISCTVKQDKTVMLDKFIAYTSGLDMPKDDLKGFLLRTLDEANRVGLDVLMMEQKTYVRRFWDMSDVTIDGDDAVQQGLRFNLFHIMQSAGRDGRTGMGAKGLSGEGYEGHYFWDTEIYVMPVFTHTFPELGRSLLDYRYTTLPAARERARELGHGVGALYPWRTINGKEASTYFPLGTAQYHINADIAYAFSQYVRVSGDYAYLGDKAAEVLCETARVWADVGSFAESRGGRYCICSVTGPDEYNAIVDNNFYTNLMARENLKDALWALHWLVENNPSAYKALVKKIKLSEDELELWQKIIDNMYFPYDEEHEIYPQDDGFMMRKPWDDSKIPPEKRHLLYENYHPLFIWRQRMSKQADAILGMYLHSNHFSIEQLRRNYDFYQTVTLHHSSLSTCIFGIVACQIGYGEEAYRYFSESARMDLDDVHNNFYAGIHAANMAGTWQAMVNGFAGMRTNAGKLELNPMLPEAWHGYGFNVGWQGSRIAVKVSKGKVSVRLTLGESMRFDLCGVNHILEREGDEVVETL